MENNIPRCVFFSRPDNYSNYSALATYDEALTYVIGTIVFLANIKFIRLLRFNKHVSHFSQTLHQARTEMLYFGLSFGVVFMAFASFGYLYFNRDMYTFSTFITTLEALYSMLIGKFDFANMIEINK